MNLYFKDDGVVRHETVGGKSGSGKSEYMLFRLSQQLRRGGGAFILDSKCDYQFRDQLHALCATYGRAADFRVVNIDNAAESHTYSPLLRGDAVAVASRFTDTVDVGQNASAEHFRAQSNLALTAALTAIKSTGLAYNAKDLYVLLTNPNAMEWLIRQLPDNDARRSFDIWLDSYRVWDNASKTMRVNTQALRNQIGGVVSRLFIYSVGEMGKVLNTYNPQVDLLNSIDNRHFVYFMIPSLEKSEAAIAFAKLLMSDTRSTLAQMYARPKWRLPSIPHQFWMDEFGSYAMRLVAQLFEMARGANVALIPMFQTYANLLNVSEEFADQIVGNSEIQTFLQLGDPNSCEWAAKVVGEAKEKLAMESRGETRSSGNKNLAWAMFHSLGKSHSRTQTTREEWGYRVRPDEFGALDIGEAISFVKGAKQGFQLRFPRAQPASVMPFSIQRYETKARAGIELWTKFDADGFSDEDRSAA